MNFHSLYRSSFYAMLFLATLVVSVDATDLNPLAMTYPLAVGVVAGVAFFTVDRVSGQGLPSRSADLLGVVGTGLMCVEWYYDSGLLLLALAHWLVYLQLVKMLQRKTINGDWFLFATGLIQVVIGGVMSQSDIVGIALFAWGLASLWVLALFSLSRDAERSLPAPGTSVVPASDPKSPYPGLVDVPFLLATLRVAAITLALGGVFFLAIPRNNASGVITKGEGVGKHLTGFDDEVQLGQLGEILENDSVVMTIELFDGEGKRITPGHELLWRGVGMALYQKGRWKKQALHTSMFPKEPPAEARVRNVIRQRIKLEPTDNPIMFGLRPILWAEATNHRFNPELNVADGSLSRSDTRPVSFDYVVYSDPNPANPQLKELFPGDFSRSDLLSIGPELKAILRPIAEEVVKGIDPADRAARAERLQAYLRDPSRFSYTLAMDVVDPTIDPVADFLLNRRQGHCEYFASALTLLLRSIDIPARLVNGFKGGDWNDLAGVLHVREKHAHSWTEALLDDAPSRLHEGPVWLTLDPTPGAEREKSVAQVGGVSGGVRQFSDFIRYVWIFYIVGFNADRQQQFLYQPIRDLFAQAMRGFEMIGKALGEIKIWLLDFPSLSSFISIRGFVVTFVSLTLLVLTARGLRFVVRRLRRLVRGAAGAGEGQGVGVLYYRRLIALLSEFGLERPATETPREFARRAATMLAGQGSGNETVADVPPLVIDAYYRIRFGQIDLDPSTVRLVEGRLAALEARLHPASP